MDGAREETEDNGTLALTLEEGKREEKTREELLL